MRTDQMKRDNDPIPSGRFFKYGAPVVGDINTSVAGKLFFERVVAEEGVMGVFTKQYKCFSKCFFDFVRDNSELLRKRTSKFNV